MKISCRGAFLALAACTGSSVFAQQYAGEAIVNQLPTLPGAEITFFKIQDPAGSDANLTLINYFSRNSSDQRIVENNIQRAVVVIHGLNRDPGTYEANMLSALSQVTNDSNINADTVAVMAPYFPNGGDKTVGYPWKSGLGSGKGSTSSALVWKGSQWSAGGNNQYPHQTTTVSAYDCLDQIIQYFDDATLYPNLKQIVISGHSLGGQAVQRYVALGKNLNTRTPVSYWIGNPNSYVWLSTDRPFATADCPDYDAYRNGFSNFSDYPMTYNADLVAQGRAAILANYNSKSKNYARGIVDHGDDSGTDCGPFTTGKDRNERLFEFLAAFPVNCPNPTSSSPCDTVDLIDSGHDAGVMFAAAASRARLFTDNFYGDNRKAYDFGYPRLQVGDDPFPDPTQSGMPLTGTVSGIFAGGMTWQGCWYDNPGAPSLRNLSYTGNANTIEYCTSLCAQGGNTIAGMENGNLCYCGTNLTSQAQTVVGSSCNTDCPGNSSQSCGGPTRLSLFSSETPLILPAPEAPAVVSGHFAYVGCYNEPSGARALDGTSTSGPAVTLEFCAIFCSGYAFFGTEYSDECYCANYINNGANKTVDSECGMLCAANGTEYCGDASRVTIYRDTDLDPEGGNLTCPASNGTVYTTNGKEFVIECNVDHSGGDMGSIDVKDFQDCVDSCASTDGCVDVSLSGAACYMKSSLGAAAAAAGIFGARLI